MTAHLSRRRGIALGTVLLLVLVAVAGGVYVFGGSGGKRITAYFDQAVGVYPGSDLRVLGVKVGSVDSVTPEGRQVRVNLTLDKGVKVPADAGAVVVAPSIVSDRYIQLSPAYTGGAQIGDRATIPSSRTASPVEVDQLYESITRISDALGPKGANSTGSLSALLDTGAANLGGNGKLLGDTIEQLGKVTKTLSLNSGNFFDTITYLQSFTTMLKNNDGNVHRAAQQLSEVTGFLAEDKENLAGALKQLATALGEVKGFIHDNRTRLKSVVDQLAPLTQSLVDQRASIAEALDTAPLAADNVLNAYDPAHRTIDGRADINELSFPLPTVGTVYGTQGATR